jgi:hypothetical protein
MAYLHLCTHLIQCLYIIIHNTQIIADNLFSNPPRKQTSDTNAARPNNELPILHGIFQLVLGPVWMFIVGLFTLC